MKKHPLISVLTLTKNRAELLRKNLQSLVGQTVPGDEIIIINNASSDHTMSVLRSFQSILPIRHYISRAHGFSPLYNAAIRKSKNQILVFFDDDCVADPLFLANHRNAHQGKTPRIVQGKSYSIPKGNIYADMMGDHYQNWLTLHKTKDGTLTTFDNKNVSLPRSVIEKYGNFDLKLGGGAEDIEMGMRLTRHGIPIVLDPTIVAYHHERTSLKNVIAQHVRFARSDAALSKSFPQESTLSMLQAKKILLHLTRAIEREYRYIQTGNIGNALMLPVLYGILLFIRVWGYATAR